MASTSSASPASLRLVGFAALTSSMSWDMLAKLLAPKRRPRRSLPPGEEASTPPPGVCTLATLACDQFREMPSLVELLLIGQGESSLSRSASASSSSSSGIAPAWLRCSTCSCVPSTKGTRNICLGSVFSKQEAYVRAPSNCDQVGTGKRTSCVSNRTSYAFAVTIACMANHTDIIRYMKAPESVMRWHPANQSGAVSGRRPSQNAITQKPSCKAVTTM
mmetsp:Transcript_82306/g.176240  ORF Transcript_82306/g.176240 Transcript_82306/m.176240 type:complete len:219 (-) Transcript_82306:253-909(-)